MSAKSIQKRLALLEESLHKIRQMKKGNAFVTDFSACFLLERLTEEYREILLENFALHKRIKKEQLRRAVGKNK